ncbi:MAG: hypothetical protein ABSC65_09360 [Acidobacteriaceae bacterium]|jgi:hypothetical protein
MKNRYAVVLWVAALLPGIAIPAGAQDAPSSTVPAPTWTIDQAVTCSVHDAWVLGGKTEPGFFAIVKALAELSAQKRDETLPDNEAVGRQFGDYIKTQAKTDHDQLLYAIVDRAVRKYGKPAAAATK